MDMVLDSDENLNDLSKVPQKIDEREGAWTSAGTNPLSYPSSKLPFPFTHTSSHPSLRTVVQQSWKPKQAMAGKSN